MSHRTLSPETQRVLKNHGVVISYAPSRMPGFLSFLLTAALFLGAFLLTFGQAFADDRNTDPTGDPTGNYYYNRYALPYVKALRPAEHRAGHLPGQRRRIPAGHPRQLLAARDAT